MSAFDRHIGHRRHFALELLQSVLTGAGFDPLTATDVDFPFSTAVAWFYPAGFQLIREVAKGSTSHLALLSRGRLPWLARQSRHQ